MTDNQAIADWLHDPTTQRIMGQLKPLADTFRVKYDSASTLEEFLDIQATRKALLIRVPELIEAMVNDTGRKDEKWSFKAWLLSR